MRSVVLAHPVDWEGWRTAARSLALEGVAPELVVWSVGEPADLFADGPRATPPAPAGSFNVSRALVALLETAIQAHDDERFSRMYRLVWRAHRGEKRLLDMTTDPDVHAVHTLAQAVRRDTHKMRAFVRFREVPSPDGPRYVSWFEPDHYIVEANASFFVRRFATMVWSILTPYRSAHWTGEALAFAPGADPAEVPDDDRLAEYWGAYYASIFNPARLKISAMTSEMPKKYWRNLPEAAAIPEMIRTAGARVSQMVEAPVMSEPVARKPPPVVTAQAASAAEGPLARAVREVQSCRRCGLWEHATQAVFGEGPADAKILMIGEQPGDQEDLAGRPFVGPAGQVLDRAMAEAGIDRRVVYVTNAVKHFKFVPRGKRRIHEKPGSSEIVACRFWVELERETIKPAVTVMLGATAAASVFGRTVTISRERGRPVTLAGNAVGFVTVHPSYLLRLPDEDAKAREYAAFVNDLRKVAELTG